jgi:hypothetical protein
MATAYWTGGTSRVLGRVAGNWLAGYIPQAGDDLVFDSTTAGYTRQAARYDGSFDGMTFGTVTASDGSNCLDGTMAAGDVTLTGESTVGFIGNPGGFCESVLAGMDGSQCTFQGTCSGSATFGGTASSYGIISGIASYGDNATDSSITESSVAYYDTSAATGATVTGQASFHDASSCNGISADSIVWNSSGTMTDQTSSGDVDANTLYLQGSLLANCLYNASQINQTIIQNYQATLANAPSSTGAVSLFGTIRIDSTNISAGNIRAGVEILGLTGAGASGYVAGGNAGF